MMAGRMRAVRAGLLTGRNRHIMFDICSYHNSTAQARRGSEETSVDSGG
jgi:hypothetical protein